MCWGASIPYFRINPLFMSPFFFKEYLNSQGKINKMVNSVDYHPNTALGFMSLQNICLYFSRTCMCHHGWGNFPNLWCSDHWKMHLRINNVESKHLYSCLLWRNSPPGSYQHLPGRGKLLTPQAELFSKICWLWKALLVIKIFKILSWLFWLCRKTAW